jgi:hypothetical protein
MDGSAKRIQKAALGAPEDHFLILLAHNGPTGSTQNLFSFSSSASLSCEIPKWFLNFLYVGLGSDLNDICGKDWELDGSGDHGDPGNS